MKKLIIAAAVAASMAFAPAHAVIVDFAAEADNNGERGLALGTDLIVVDGVEMVMTAFGGPTGLAHAYLDAGNAGLGVCQNLTAGDQCDPGNDDNVTSGESILIEFAQNGFSDLALRSINGLVFRDAGHNLINAANDGVVRIITDNGDMTALFSTFIAMAAAQDAFFNQTSLIFFENVQGQFYVSAMDLSEIPLPAALPLLLSGLAGLGFSARRRKSA